MNEADLRERVARLDLGQKVRLLTGATAWLTHALESIGLRALALSDGPAGVRGTRDRDILPSASFPSPTALAATWDRAVAERVGALFAIEARHQAVDVVLAPAINLQRTPYGGRHFETYSEDPLLTAEMGAALVRGIQAYGIAATPKHYVGNESETDRTSYVARIDERTLREVYLPPFEAAVRAGAWALMVAYNGVDDGVEAAPATEHDRLVNGILKDEWGYDGVVMSDWMAAKTVAASALGGLDLVMPGPDGPWSHGALQAAVESGEVPERVIDDKTLRLLRLASRVGALDDGSRPVVPAVDMSAELRALAARSTVVLRNEGALPLSRAGLHRIALIGPNAVDFHSQGGGSSHVNPVHVVSPEEGLRSALPDVELEVVPGCDPRTEYGLMDASRVNSARIDFLDAAGAVLESRPTQGTTLRIPAPTDAAAWARLTLGLNFAEPGQHRLLLGVLGRHTTSVDGRVVHRHEESASEREVLTSVSNNPPGADLGVQVDGEPRRLEVVIDVELPTLGDFGRWTTVMLRHRPPQPSPAQMLEAAVVAARRADIAVVMVGTSDAVESEGFDRPSIALAGEQDALVRAIVTAAPITVAVVNAGGPVLLPWIDEVDAVLWHWLPGEQGGHALADVLLGIEEPAGRLPWTLPAAEADIPVTDVTPVDGVLEYREGVLVGYRAWDARGLEPARPFGFGLGYSSWSLVSASAPASLRSGERLEVDVVLRNDGPREGSHIVQLYLEPPAGGTPRPPRQLAAFATVSARPGKTVSATLAVPARAFQYWDVARHDWNTDTGEYSVVVARNSREIMSRHVVTLTT